ncbi:MAG TPA: peptidoglycan DD-metalloendopeptidase family protein, partial [Pseudoxanthomonas sp.]|nr:peptidoglycan DD-metalloendopeptidase family protein [Pseudoxanthomonas sp.]
MKYLLLVLLGFVLGAYAYRQFDIQTSPRAAPTADAVETTQTETAPLPSTEPVTQSIAQAPLPADVQPVPVAALPPQASVAVPPQVESAAGVAGLLLPVQGIAREQLHDTFTDARSQGRSHDAIDIMAPAGTPVLAVADGRVEKLFTSVRGGLTIYQFEPSGRLAYYYAHLQRYADGLTQGQALRRGQVIGYVGSTGNASP